MGATRRIAIALPLRNEEAELPACLAALDAAAAHAGAPVTLVAFANGCADGSVAMLQSYRPRHLALDWRSATLLPPHAHAGWARRLALDAAAEHLGADGDLLLSTDADSRVASDWIVRTIAHANAGYAAVAGLALTTRADRAAMGGVAMRRMNALGRYAVLLAYLRSYARPRAQNPWYDPWPRHGYAGGASIAVTLAAYRAIGGAPTPPIAEDRALFAAVAATGGAIRHAIDVRVFTSCRMAGRAPGGMADTLLGWATQDEAAPIHETWGLDASLRGARAADEPLTFARLPAAIAAAQARVRAIRFAATNPVGTPRAVRPAPR